ncbi:hypothetical protein AB0M54_16260 [Actinoplanes sp. NPDC051470]|uniref:hypothetical protein n=1 Tax=unclassified Actinoplanes TaxID=2626549 RepID=UPI0034335E82
MRSNESILRLRAAVSALVDVDISAWDDTSLNDHLAELSSALCEVDAELSRVADAIRARGFRVVEPIAA